MTNDASAAKRQIPLEPARRLCAAGRDGAVSQLPGDATEAHSVGYGSADQETRPQGEVEARLLGQGGVDRTRLSCRRHGPGVASNRDHRSGGQHRPATTFRAIDGLERRGWIATYQRRGRSTIYWPKRPCDLLCRGCFTMLPSGTTDCPVCGIEAGKGVPERHRGVPERHP